MKYWVMLNGVQLGPLDPEQTRALPLTPETPVWSEGFPDWTPAAQVADLADLFGQPRQPQYGQYNPQQPPQQGSYSQGYNQGFGQGYSQGDAQGFTQGYNRGYNQGYNQGGGDILPPEPPTYLAWSILAMLLCCLPFGIVAIIQSAGVSSAYSRGDYEGAKRKSDSARNWIIASVVTGVVVSGLYMLIYAPFAALANL